MSEFFLIYFLLYILIGVAFSKHIVQMYTYNPAGELRQHLEVCFELSFSLWVLMKCSCVADTFLLQIDAHVGGVNDIAFAHPNKQLCIVTCGDDKTIKVKIFNSMEVLCCFFNVLMDHVLQVWDAVAGRRLYMFEGHEAPVYSVCPHYKENIQVSLLLLALFLLCGYTIGKFHHII